MLLGGQVDKIYLNITAHIKALFENKNIQIY